MLHFACWVKKDWCYNENVIGSNGVNHELENFFSAFPTLTYGKKEHILRPHQPITQVCFLKSGYIRQYSISANGNEFTLNIFKPGSILFFIQLLHGEENNYYFQAFTTAEVYTAKYEPTLEFLTSHPLVTLNILKRIGQGLNRFLAQVESMTFCGSREKLATTLLILSMRFGRKNKNMVLIDLPLTHYDLACMIGVSRETVSMEIKRLERAKIVERHQRHIFCINPEKIKEIATIRD